MSHRKVPFHFDENDPLDKSAWKRFGFRPDDERRMFFETSPMNSGWSDWQSKFHRPYYDDPEWRGRTMFSQCGSEPDSPSMQRRMRGWNSSNEEGGVPIKVVHERTPPRSNDDGTDSETSSQASHGSQGSSSSQPQRAKITREPRVHHIPIMVEPREGSTSSGYASDGATEMSTMNHDVEDQRPDERTSYNGQPQKPEGSRINSVPIRLNGNMRAESPSRVPNTTFGQQTDIGSAKFGSPGPNAFQPTAPPRQRNRPSSQPPSSPQATTGGPHITRIPMNMDTSETKTPVPPEPEEKPEKKVKTGVDPMAVISDILKEVIALGAAVESFSSNAQDKQYRYLDEMLTRCMLKLDDIETDGRDDIRQSRKAAIREVQKCINQLEAKIRPSNSVPSDSKSGSMDVDSVTEDGTTEMQSSEAEAEIQKSNSKNKVDVPELEQMEAQSCDVQQTECPQAREPSSEPPEKSTNAETPPCEQDKTDQSDNSESQANTSGR